MKSFEKLIIQRMIIDFNVSKFKRTLFHRHSSKNLYVFGITYEMTAFC